MKKLSILIPTLPERGTYLRNIMYILQPQVDQYRTDVEIRINDAGKMMTTGQKRNEMIANSDADYTVFVDDDDWVPNFYVKEILKAIESSPDYVGFQGWMTTNGHHRVNFEIKKGHPYIEVTTEKLIQYPLLAHLKGWYVRFPNILTPMKREISSSVRFPHLTKGEDYPWAKEIHDRGLIKTESFIDKMMYHYMFRNGIY